MTTVSVHALATTMRMSQEDLAVHRWLCAGLLEARLKQQAHQQARRPEKAA